MLPFFRIAGEFGFTAKSIGNVIADWIVLRARLRFPRKNSFAFLVHPRTSNLKDTDVYGRNDIFKAVPSFRHLYKLMPASWADKIVYAFVKWNPPSTLSRITVRGERYEADGYLLTTSRPVKMMLAERDATQKHLRQLFELADRKGVGRVGLGALLPALTDGGKIFTESIRDRPAVSTGHAFTAYVITEFLSTLVSQRNRGGPVRVAVVGAGGSTGKAIVRTLIRAWSMQPIDLLLIDVREDRLRLVADEALHHHAFRTVQASRSLSDLRDVEYVIVVTNGTHAIVHPEHVRPGTVIIDDSQPRNTTPSLLRHGCFVLDVLVRIVGLDCRFDFGIRTTDKTVAFTCLGELVAATIAGDFKDLAVGDVTGDVIERTLEIVEKTKKLGLFGKLPLFSFGREMSIETQKALLRPVTSALTAAE